MRRSTIDRTHIDIDLDGWTRIIGGAGGVVAADVAIAHIVAANLVAIVVDHIAALHVARDRHPLHLVGRGAPVAAVVAVVAVAIASATTPATEAAASP